MCPLKKKKGAPAIAQQVKNPTASPWVAAEMWVSPPAQHSGLKNLALLQQVTAMAQIRVPAWELPYAQDVAKEEKKKKKKKKSTENFKNIWLIFSHLLKKNKANRIKHDTDKK